MRRTLLAFVSVLGIALALFAGLHGAWLWLEGAVVLGLQLALAQAGRLQGLAAHNGGATALLEASFRSPLALLAVALGCLAASRGLRRVTSSRRQLEQVFGAGRRLTAAAPLRRPSPVCLQPGLLLWANPKTGRRLEADFWRPAHTTQTSGLAFLHFRSGSGKDLGKRAYFRRLASQGHLVLDVAAPQDRQPDMLRALAWMKANAGRYGARPQHVVAWVNSASDHGALLAACASGASLPAQPGAEDGSFHVSGVVAYYAPSNGHSGSAGPAPLAGAALACPPTLFLQGDADFISAAQSGRSLVLRLKEAGAPVVCVVYPQAGHAIDWLWPQISPVAQSTLDEVDRFLALLSAEE